MDSPGSPLSETLSDAPATLRSVSATPEPDLRPTKRQRISMGGVRGTSVKNSTKIDMDQLDDTAVGGFFADADISSDTDGSVSGSVHGLPAGLDDEDDKAAAGGKEQVSICRWEDCDAGDQGNMDVLVKHLHEEHIHARQKKYSCEWIDCTRKGHPHASGYALRAHMRSHTREKPFYCTLPECDRSFTRSDALAKHMRTVHETEALRPSDPVPKHHSSNPTNKVQRIKLTFNKFSAGLNGNTDEESITPSKRKTPEDIALGEPIDDEKWNEDNVQYFRDETSKDGWRRRFQMENMFEEEELDENTPPQLYALMKKQVQWALEERDQLDRDLYAAEKRRKGEWIAKEMVLADAIAQAQAAASDDDDAIADADDAEDEDVLMDAKSRHEDDDEETMIHPETSPPPPAILPPLPYSNAAMSIDSSMNGL